MRQGEVMMAGDGRRGLRCGLCLLALLLAGALAQPGGAEAAIRIQAFEFAATEADGEPSTQAGAHPYQATTSLGFTGDGSLAYENPRNIVLDLPPGLVGILAAMPTCKGLEFQFASCSPESQIGYVRLTGFNGGEETEMFYPLSRIETIPGRAAAEFGINAGVSSAVRLQMKVRTGDDYGLSISAANLSQTLTLNEVEITLWGVPADPSHNSLRGECLSLDGPTGGSCPSEAPRLPLLTNPSACLPVLSVEARVDSWQSPGAFDSATSSNEDGEGNPVGIEGCESLDFRPAISLAPSVATPRTPAAMAFDLRAPQPQSAGAAAEATLKDAAVWLPEGVSISPPAAAGLGVCTPDQIRLGDDSEPSCPDASKLGTVRIETPMLATPLNGSVYLAAPGENPFGSRFAVYGVAGTDGALIKLAGRVDPDPATGQLRVSFEDVPQLPFSEVEVSLFGGPRAPLSTPPRCGTYATGAELTAWGAGAPVARTASFALGAGCAEPPFAPSLRAGAANPTAGAFSPFVLKLQRGDRDGEFASSLSLDLPPGVAAALRGRPYCPEGELRAGGSAGPGCPDSSRVGQAVVGAGLGPRPLFLTGEVYLSGPFGGAPFSLAVVVPASAGPFDLGSIVERIAVDVDPRSGRLSARADGLPQIRDGIPLELRSLAIELDRPGFIRNPTSCAPMAIVGSATTGPGRSVPLSQPFQVGGCSSLAFKPRLALSVLGGAARGGHPALRAVLRAGAREATIAAATVDAPAGELLDLRHLGAMCDRALPADRCPAASRLGRARVWTPLLGEPLRGSIYLRAPGGRLPGLVVDLRGSGLRLLVEGRVAAADGRLRMRLANLPDLPLSKAVFTLAGGRRGLLVNSEALCARKRRVKASLRGHNGALRGVRPVVRIRGGC